MEHPEAEKRDTSEREAAGSDLTPFLSAWEYDESRAVRRIRASSGREVLQVRLPLGIEQYEINGRPDGKRPMHQDSWLHYYTRRARTRENAARARSATGKPYVLSESDFRRLQHEGLLYYYRYLLFFQIQEYRLCARDTRRNLRLLDFVAQHAPSELGEQLEQYRPYILRMHVIARALERIQRSGNVRFSLRLLREGRRMVEALEPIPGNQVFEWEKARALVSLDDLISQLEAQVPVSRRDQLRRQLETAIQEENYEKAAVLRDEIARLGRRPRR